MGRRLAVFLLVLGLAAPATGLASATWAHWSGNWFSCWLPNKQWQVAEGQNNLNISSPTGTDVVTYQYATNMPGSVTPLYVANLIFRNGNEDLHPLTNVRILRRSAVANIGNGGQRQSFEWTGLRHYRTGGTQAVHGVVIVAAYSSYGASGIEAYAKAAPESVWRSHAALLEAIRSHITFYGHD